MCIKQEGTGGEGRNVPAGLSRTAAERCARTPQTHRAPSQAVGTSAAQHPGTCRSIRALGKRIWVVSAGAKESDFQKASPLTPFSIAIEQWAGIIDAKGCSST